MKTEEAATRDRYAAAAIKPEAALCCPVEYDPKYLEIIPQEVIEKDYGCGDPSRWLKEGDTVLDLGSGTGKICFIAAQVVGPTGKVIGVDMTDDMLEVAHRNNPIIAEKLGYDIVEFRKGRIQDLALDLEMLEEELAARPIGSANAFLELDEITTRLRKELPLIPDASVDVVVSNCVLNLVEPHLKDELFREIYRVLRKGGRAVISDIVSDEVVPEHLMKDDYLWSGCISGALSEVDFMKAFENVGFYGSEWVKFEQEPWQTVEGIEFRSVTIQAWKGKEGSCIERNQAVVYNGPFAKVTDDDGHTMERGQRYAVCDKTYHLYKKAPYASHFTFIDPLTEIPVEEAKEFDCSRTVLRHPRETKGQDYNLTTDSAPCCEGDSCC